TGAVNLGNGVATLNVTTDFSPAPAIGSTFTIINNDDNDSVTGYFAGKPEGTVFTAGGYTFEITYQGGDDNDVVLTVINPASPTLQGTPGADTFTVTRDGSGNAVITLQGNTIWTTPLAGLSSL